MKEESVPNYTDITYEVKDRIAWITFNRPHRMNALTNVTMGELADAIARAGNSREAGIAVISGAGGRAFCVGGDVKERTDEGYGEITTGLGLSILNIMKTIPKVVIAMVDGYAIGFGNIMAFNCDLTICSDRSTFGQVGPKFGSFDLGWGSSYLARVVGPKKAREIWYLCRQYNAQEALGMGLVNKVVPHDDLRAEVEQWCREILEKSPTAISQLKASFLPDIANIMGISTMGHFSLDMYYRTEEAQEGSKAFQEKRQPDYSRYNYPNMSMA